MSTKEKIVFDQIYDVEHFDYCIYFKIGECDFMIDYSNNMFYSNIINYLPSHNKYNLSDALLPKTVRKEMTDNYGGYYLLCIIKTVKIRIHRLISYLIHGEDVFNSQVNHIDGDRENNNPENLELVTPLENSQNAVNRGAFYPNSKIFTGAINKDVYLQIKIMISDGLKNCEISRILNIDPAQISRIRHNKWNSGGVKYLELKNVL